MSGPTWRAIDVLTRQLELCDVLADESAVVLSDGLRPAVTVTTRLALERLGTVVHVLEVAPGDDLGTDPVVQAMLDASDMVIDLTDSTIDTDDATPALLGDGRMLKVLPRSVEALHELVPHVGALRRVERGEAVLANTSRLRVSSETGTNLTIDLSGSETAGRPDTTTGAGSIARWPDAALVIVPSAASTSGTIVLMPGDVVIDFDEFVRSPVTLTIEKDHICDIDGEAAAADLLRAHLETTGEAAAYGVADLTVGLTRVVRGEPPRLLEHRLIRTARCEAGLVTVSTGSNHVAERTAERGVRLLLRNCTVMVDNRPLVDAGELCGEIAPDAYELAADPT